jgi:hypothetical protein
MIVLYYHACAAPTSPNQQVSPGLLTLTAVPTISDWALYLLQLVLRHCMRFIIFPLLPVHSIIPPGTGSSILCISPCGIPVYSTYRSYIHREPVPTCCQHQRKRKRRTRGEETKRRKAEKPKPGANSSRPGSVAPFSRSRSLDLTRLSFPDRPLKAPPTLTNLPLTAPFETCTTTHPLSRRQQHHNTTDLPHHHILPSWPSPSTALHASLEQASPQLMVSHP